MTDSKKTTRPKFISTKDINMSDFLNESQQFEKPVPKKRGPKRQKQEINEDEEDISKLIGIYEANAKKKRCEDAFDSKESRQKLLNVLGQQMETRKGMHMNFLQGLQEVVTQIEMDHDALRENEQKLEQLASVFLKCIKQTSSAQKQNLKSLKDLHGEFKKECEEMESVQKAESGKLADELQEDMNKLQQQLVAETKRKQFENFRRTIFHAIQNDL